MLLAVAFICSKNVRNVMNNRLKHATVSVLLCSFLLLLNMDLSYVKTSLLRVVTKAAEKRQIEKIYKEQRHIVTLPNTDIILRESVFVQMSSYIDHSIVDEGVTMKSTIVPMLGTSCRGSPIARSP